MFNPSTTKFHLQTEFKERLAELIKERGWTDEAFADKIGYTKGQVSKLLSGVTPKPSRRFLEACRREAGFNPEWLLTGALPRLVANASASSSEASSATLNETALPSVDESFWKYLSVEELVNKATRALNDKEVPLPERLRRSEVFLSELRRRAFNYRQNL